MIHFTVDQAGKIEDTSSDTVLALYSEEIQYSIKIPKIIRQEIFSLCKKRYKKILTLRLFAYGLYLLLKDKLNGDSVIIIDEEYPKHSKDIKQLLLNHLRIKNENIRFSLVGKCDGSHRIANQTYSGKLKPNEVITEKQFNLSKILPQNKIKEYLR